MTRRAAVAGATFVGLLLGWAGGADVVADGPARSARVDVAAETPGLTLADGTIVAPGGSIGRPNWLSPAEQAANYTAEFGIVSFAAPEVKLSFTPAARGQVAILLRGPWTDRGDKRLFVHWESCEIAGATWRTRPALRETWHDEPIAATADVIGGRPVVLTLRARSGGPDAGPPGLARVSDPSIAAVLARPFQRGVNLSNWLEVPPGQSWGDNSVTAEELAKIKAAGFDHIRLPVGWQNYAGTAAPYTIDEKLFARVDAILTQATTAGLAVLVNVHHYDALTDDDPAREIPRLVAIWRQLAAKWKDRPATVAFEILNEPREKADAAVVNTLTSRCLAAIRESNPTRAVFVGPADFNAITQLENLVLPVDDPRLIVTVHTYAPFVFTHQGASWSAGLSGISGVAYPGPGAKPPVVAGEVPSYLTDSLATYQTAPPETNPVGPKAIAPLLDLAAGYARATGRPVHLGEFGAYEKADAASRLRYYADVTRLCRERGIGWAAWDWKAGFAVSDRRTHELLPGMREALFGSDAH